MPYYQLEVTRAGHLDALAVNVECAGQASAGGEEHLRAQLERAVKAHVGISVRVNVLSPGSLERSLGKAMRVVDKRRG